jgi:hypothetical protein
MLCETCLNLDLEAVLSKDGYIHLDGPSWKRSKEQGCEFCSLMFDVAFDDSVIWEGYSRKDPDGWKNAQLSIKVYPGHTSSLALYDRSRPADFIGHYFLGLVKIFVPRGRYSRIIFEFCSEGGECLLTAYLD